MPPPSSTGCQGRFCTYGSRLSRALMRKKTVNDDTLEETKLDRCLNTLDLTALGVGSTLGAGVYVIAGEVAQKTAGPAVIISFLIATAASVLAGLCYAEFGARVPKSGSAYVYSYVSVGEIMAFVIGWNLILEYVIGTASVARAWSQNFDNLIGNHIIPFFTENVSMSIPGLAAYPDFFAFIITMLLTAILAVGVKESAWFTKIFTLLNLTVLLIIVISGFWHVDIANWKIPPLVNGTEFSYLNKTFDSNDVQAGGFAPFGFEGIISGAGTCFYAFVGFDAIATTGEEVINPQKAIPISIVICLCICFVAYFSLSAVLTLMIPYFALDPLAPLPSAFEDKGWTISKYIIAVGAICALSTSLLGAMFPLPRVIYAMGSDGLIFRFMAKVNERVSTPLIATILSGFLAAVMACFFELKELVDMMSIGTLLAYTLVAVSVLILRGNVEDQNTQEVNQTSNNEDNDHQECESPLVKRKITGNFVDKDLHEKAYPPERHEQLTLKNYLKFSFKTCGSCPSPITELINKVNTFTFFILAYVLAYIMKKLGNRLNEPVIATFAALVALIMILLAVTLWRQPENHKKIAFKVPLVPWIPCISIFVNTYLMMALPDGTWKRFGIWMALGFLIYFAYGIRNSEERKVHRPPQELQLELVDADPDSENNQKHGENGLLKEGDNGHL